MKKFLILTLFSILFVLTNNAYANVVPDINPTIGNTTAFGQVAGVACSIANVLNGPIARTVATIGIIFLGFGAFFGKLNWGAVLTTALGIFIIFGAAQIIGTVAADSDNTAAVAEDKKCVKTK
jgi:type IV secretory pathway VirB2 component (pilin)